MRTLSAYLYAVGRRVFGDTFLEPLASRLYWHVSALTQRAISPINFYRVDNLPDPFSPYLIALSKPQNEILYGEYERPVLERFATLVDEDSTVWEIGARWGYYSFAASTVARQVVAAEADGRRVSLLHASRYANGADNVKVVSGVAGVDYQIDEFEPPDVALIDVEGAELSVLESADRWLAAGRTEFLIEVHDSRGGALDSELSALLESADYEVEDLAVRSTRNRHVHASPGS